MEDEFFGIAGLAEFTHSILLCEKNSEGPFDVVFIEGSVTTGEDEEFVKRLRENSKHLVSVGACACTGGVNAIEKPEDVKRIADVVKVDYFVRGCPPNKEDVVQVLRELAHDRMPVCKGHAVCFECKLAGPNCLLRQNVPCLGSIAIAGCNAVCPANGVKCEACRGVLSDANPSALKALLKTKGFNDADFDYLLSKYCKKVDLNAYREQ